MNRWVAALLSLLFPGAGEAFTGRTVRAVVAAVLAVACIPGMALFGWPVAALAILLRPASALHVLLLPRAPRANALAGGLTTGLQAVASLVCLRVAYESFKSVWGPVPLGDIKGRVAFTWWHDRH